MDIDYEDFIRLCRVIPEMNAELPESMKASITEAALNGGWAPWITIRRDGVYFRPPERQNGLGDAEIAAIYDCPITDPETPALRFPCSFEKFEKFLEEYSLYPSVDPFDMLQWQREQQSRSLDLNKQARQEQAILTALSGEGIDPQSLPKNPRGKPGIKRKIKQSLLGEGKLFGSAMTFDKAWERLRADGRLKDA